MRVLVVGGGGREHALCWALARGLGPGDLFAAPGNPGTALHATNLPVGVSEIDRLVSAAQHHVIDLVVVGPEAPLAEGLADRLREAGRAVFGPSAAAARIESSKAFAKDVMAKANVPTAASRTFTEIDLAIGYVDRQEMPIVVKASGLAAGKGAVICQTRGEAHRIVTAMLRDGLFGEAGRTLVIEAFLEGEEVTVMAVTNGEEILLLPPAQDHKRLGEGDKGPNTGGMGAYSPVSFATATLLEEVERRILRPTLEELARRGSPFSGVLYAGLMVDRAGSPTVIEFNCRLGDPETQAVLPRIRSGLLELLRSSATGERLSPIEVTPWPAVTTVLASHGYPEEPRRGDVIELPPLPEGTLVFHAGTQSDQHGVLRTNGGRVLSVTALAETFLAAQEASRSAAEAIRFDGKQFRRDIGWREGKRLEVRS
jgi:phosphoribosylamine--glycine ligase